MINVIKSERRHNNVFNKNEKVMFYSSILIFKNRLIALFPHK